MSEYCRHCKHIIFAFSAEEAEKGDSRKGEEVPLKEESSEVIDISNG